MRSVAEGRLHGPDSLRDRAPGITRDMEYVVGAIIGLAAGVGVGYVLHRLVLGGAHKTRDEILKDASREADNLRKSRELEIKEDLLKRREALDKELATSREALRDDERKLVKRETQLEDEQENLRKRERMIETAQNRLAEKRGCTTAVAPAHIVASIEYACAFVWNSGRVTRCTSSARRSSCVALIRAPHNAFAWVQSTPFGREVVPEVYCTLKGASGSWARAGRRVGSPSMRSNDCACWGRFEPASSPLSVSVTASQRSPGQARATRSANRGCVMPATAPEFSQ